MSIFSRSAHKKIILNGLGARELGIKKFKKYVGKMFKNSNFYFIQILTRVTFYYRHFQGLFRYINFSPVA